MKKNVKKGIFFSGLFLLVFTLSLSVFFFLNNLSKISSSISSTMTSPSLSSSFDNGNVEDKPIILNAEDITILQGDFFSPLKDVKGYSTKGEDITENLIVEGNVDYGTSGTYQIKYILKENDLVNEKIRNITVIDNKDYNKKEEPYIYEAKEDYVISQGAKTFGNYKDNNLTSYLTDGNLSTRYESIWEETTSIVTIDLGADLSFDKITIYWEAASSKNYIISTSIDNKQYVNIKTVNGAYGTRNDEINLSGKGRYVRFTLKDKSMEAYGYSIYEIEIYGKKGLAIPKSEYPTLFDEKVIQDNQSLEVDLKKDVQANRLYINFVDLNPSNYKVLIFNKEWVEIYMGASSNVNFNQEYTFNKIRFDFISRPINSYCYRVSEIRLYNGEEEINLQNSLLTASSTKYNHNPELALNNYGNFWASDYLTSEEKYFTIDLGSIKNIGKIELLFENNYGKIYDIESSNDVNNYQLIYRELHGARRLQSILLNIQARSIRIREYSNNSSYRHRIENITISSITPPYDQKQEFTILDLPVVSSIDIGKGSYALNDPAFPSARYISYDERDKDGAVPSNGVYQSLLINNFGHAMYLYPLRVKYSENGLGISNPGEGYFETTYNRSQTVTDSIDLTLAPLEELNEVQTSLIDDSDMTFGVAFSDNSVRKMVNYFSQGLPYVSSFFANKKAKISFNSQTNIMYGNEILLEGKTINDKFVILETNSLAGYKKEDNTPFYELRRYIISSSQESEFKRVENGIEINLSSNYLSICPLPDLADVDDFYNSSLAPVLKSKVDYEINENSQVTTTYKYLSLFQNAKHNKTKVVMLPHQRKKSLTNYKDQFYKSVRGNLYIVDDDKFITNDQFYGISALPNEPTDTSYSKNVMHSYLEKLERDTAGNHLGEDAYWQGKSLHPLANGALIADTLGYNDLKDIFVNRLETILKDWYTYSGINDKYYFYFDKEWGTLYYRVSEFGANVSLADHHFTYGYFAFATMVCFSYDENFKADYKDMADLLILDYMNYTDDESLFCKFRNFDYYSGHSWAGGYADSDGGNNQESASEALNSYQAAYLYSEVTENKEMKDAAIYCYVTELSAVKQYWFNYDNDSYSEEYEYHGVGQIYGGSNFYGTFFNGDPTYIYGIHFLPGGEYLSSYAIGEDEKEKLKSLYLDYIKEEENWTGHEAEDGYQHILWVILSIFDPDEALSRLETRLNEIENSSELFNVYYLIHSFKSLGTRSNKVYSSNLSSTVYEKDGECKAIVNNLTNQTKTVTFYKEGKEISTSLVAPHTITEIDPYKNCDIKGVIDASNNIEFNNAQNIYQKDDNIYYSFYLYFKSNSSYRLKLNVINETNIEMNINVLNDKNEVLTSIKVPKDDNVILYSEELYLYGKFTLTFEIPSSLIVNNFTFEKI